jgi:hypothetical protein
MSFVRTSPRRTAAVIAGLAVAVAGVLVTAGASGAAALLDLLRNQFPGDHHQRSHRVQPFQC